MYDALGRHDELIKKGRRLRREAEYLQAKVKRQIEHLEWLVESIRRERQPDFFQRLRKAIRVMYGCGCQHLDSFAMRKVRDGKVLWLGVVEEFALDGAEGGARCYAWQYAEDGQPRTFTVLRQGLVNSPHAAVQLFLLAKDVPPTLHIPV